jgi:hypothetical protein
MPELLDPTAASPPDADTATPPRTRETIRAEWQALVERIKTIPRDGEEGKRLRIRILELWAEEVDYIPEEEFAENREALREMDSRRPAGQKLFPHLSEEGGA